MGDPPGDRLATRARSQLTVGVVAIRPRRGRVGFSWDPFIDRTQLPIRDLPAEPPRTTQRSVGDDSPRSDLPHFESGCRKSKPGPSVPQNPRARIAHLPRCPMPPLSSVNTVQQLSTIAAVSQPPAACSRPGGRATPRTARSNTCPVAGTAGRCCPLEWWGLRLSCPRGTSWCVPEPTPTRQLGSIDLYVTISWRRSVRVTRFWRSRIDSTTSTTASTTPRAVLKFPVSFLDVQTAVEARRGERSR